MRTETSVLVPRAAVVLMTGGRGGSAISEFVKSGNEAVAGGCAGGLIVERSPPGCTGCIKAGPFFPKLVQVFTAKT